MNFLDTLRALLGLGDRRIRPKLGLPDDRRASSDRRKPSATQEALYELERQAHVKWKCWVCGKQMQDENEPVELGSGHWVCSSGCEALAVEGGDG